MHGGASDGGWNGGAAMMPGMENIGLRWRQIRFNPLRSLTPVRLASALDSSAAGWLRESALIFETIEQREAIVRSVMTKRRAAVARRDWQVITPDPDHPNAEAHKATLEYFYNNLSVTDATDLNVRSGMSGLLRQMMDAIIQRYAVHEIVWKPGTEGLTAELRRVPLYFFENRSGRLRFIGPENRADGMDLEEDGWMITVADGLGEALSICYMFKRLAIQDALAFSEKFSVPGVLGRTSAAKDTPEGNAMRDSVLAYANEWIGVNYSDDGSIKDPIQVIQTPGGSGTMPSMTLAEYMDRMIATLVRGGDLSTISREGDSSGSNRQQDETDALLEDDCALVSETLQIQLDRAVIRMVHGDETPAAYVVVNPPSNTDLTQDLAIDEGLARLGVTQDPEDLAERYGRETQDLETQDAREEEAKRKGAEDAEGDAEEDEEKGTANLTNLANEDETSFSDSQLSTQDSQLSAIREALTTDLQPLGEALAGALQAGDLPAMQAALRKISENMPELAGDAEALTAVLAGQFADAFMGDAEEVENAARYNPQDKGARGWFIPWNQSRESRGGAHKDQFGPVPSKENPLDSEQQQARAWRGMEHVMATQGKAPKAVIREDLGEIQFDYGDPSKETGWGLSHIKAKHPDAWHRIPATLVEGKAFQHPVNESKAIIAKSDHMVVIQRKDKRHGWVVSGLEDPKTIGKLTPLKK